MYNKLDRVLKLKFVAIVFEPITPKISPCWFGLDIFLRPDSSDIPQVPCVMKKV